MEMNKEKIINKEHFKNIVSQARNGQEVSFTYYRNGMKNEIKILL